jgi:hypothetical protein
MRTCQFCGSPVDGAEPEAAQIEAAQLPIQEPAALPAAVTQAARATQAAPRAPSASVVALKKFLLMYVAPIVGGAVVLLIALGFVSYLSKSKPNGDAGDTAAERESEASATGPVKRSELGVEIYPGAEPLSDGERNSSFGNTVISQSFSTSDKTAAVIDFYRVRMVGHASIYADVGGGVVVTISPKPKDSIRVAISPAPSGGTTRIYISHTLTE